MEKFFDYFCSSEWHFARFTGKGAYHAHLIYTTSLHLSKKSGVFFASIPRLATYLGCDERSVRKAIKLLLDTGFLIKLAEEPGKSVRYKPVHHRDWAVSHPGCCAEKLEMPSWFGDGDPLGRALYAASGGNFKTYPNFLKGMRNIGHDDAAILRFWGEFLLVDRPAGPRWHDGVYARFMKHLRNQPVTPSNPLHPMQGVPLTTVVSSPLASVATSPLASVVSLIPDRVPEGRNENHANQ